MKNSLIENIEYNFNQIGINDFTLVYQSYDSKNFGNAEAIYELGNLRLRFTRDRGQNILDIQSSLVNSEDYYSFSSISLMMGCGWQNLNEIINISEPINFNIALGYIKNNFASLEEAFSTSKRLITDAKLKNAEQKIINAMFNKR